jgi:sialate O-acetylesterase
MRRLNTGLLAMLLITAGWATSAFAGVVDDATEAAGYSLVYELQLPDNAAYNVNGVPYAQDLADTIDMPFDRVAYHLELQKPGEERVWVYVSMPTLVLTANQTGVPSSGTGVVLQQMVEGLHVASNHPDLAGLSNLDTGAVEFWPTHYMVTHSAGIPGASDGVYDWGDQPAGNGDYGSMQIHDYASGTTLFAYSAWGGAYNDSDLGIGNNPGEHPDWTFTANASSYTLKTLLAPPGRSATTGKHRSV